MFLSPHFVFFLESYLPLSTNIVILLVVVKFWCIEGFLRLGDLFLFCELFAASLRVIFSFEAVQSGGIAIEFEVLPNVYVDSLSLNR
jgi:hypothetical protein